LPRLRKLKNGRRVLPRKTMRTETAHSNRCRLFWVIAPQFFFDLVFIISGTGKLPRTGGICDVLLKLQVLGFEEEGGYNA